MSRQPQDPNEPWEGDDELPPTEEERRQAEALRALLSPDEGQSRTEDSPTAEAEPTADRLETAAVAPGQAAEVAGLLRVAAGHAGELSTERRAALKEQLLDTLPRARPSQAPGPSPAPGAKPRRWATTMRWVAPVSAVAALLFVMVRLGVRAPQIVPTDAETPSQETAPLPSEKPVTSAEPATAAEPMAFEEIAAAPPQFAPQPPAAPARLARKPSSPPSTASARANASAGAGRSGGARSKAVAKRRAAPALAQRAMPQANPQQLKPSRELGSDRVSEHPSTPAFSDPLGRLRQAVTARRAQARPRLREPLASGLAGLGKVSQVETLQTEWARLLTEINTPKRLQPATSQATAAEAEADAEHAEHAERTEASAPATGKLTAQASNPAAGEVVRRRAVPSSELQADLYCRLAQAALRLGSPQAALSWTKRGLALRAPPRVYRAELYALRSEALQALGRPTQAANSRRRATEIFSGSY